MEKLDYVWLGFTAVGLFSAVADVRVTSAKRQLDLYQQKEVSRISNFKATIEMFSSSSGPVCRTVPSHYSSPEKLAEIQMEYERACDWFKELASTLPSAVEKRVVISPDSLKARPNASTGGLNELINQFYILLDAYNREAKVLNDLSADTRHTRFDDALVFLGPFLLAVGLALRITKITG